MHIYTYACNYVHVYIHAYIHAKYPHIIQYNNVIYYTQQVVRGLLYLHDCGIIYYDLKSPNVLVFRYPSAYYSIQCTAGTSNDQITSTPKHSMRKPGFVGVQETGEVYVKIADLGISRQAITGRSMGFKGSPGFMAPEILKYMGTEACTNKVKY